MSRTLALCETIGPRVPRHPESGFCTTACQNSKVRFKRRLEASAATWYYNYHTPSCNTVDVPRWGPEAISDHQPNAAGSAVLGSSLQAARYGIVILLWNIKEHARCVSV
eukprot:2553916-Pyramimonas_sp.AAC.1